MNPIVRELVNQNVHQLTLKDIIRHSKKENIPMTVKEAKRILSILHQRPFDIADKKRVQQLHIQLKKEFPKQYKKALVLLEPYKEYLE